MIRRKNKLEIPGLNTTSTADISFMLLIFFLVVSSMDIDQGLTRQLPPMEKERMMEETLVNKDRLLRLEITEDNVLKADGESISINQLRHQVSTFVLKVGKSHLISIDAHPSSSYDTYFQVQNELVNAYKDVREKLSMRQYGKSFELLTKEQKTVVRNLIPQHIAETYHSADLKGGEND
jgi:biopolymer transport protein ExbD